MISQSRLGCLLVIVIVTAILAAVVIGALAAPPPKVTAGECRTMCKMNGYNGWLYDPVKQECTCVGSSA